MSPGLFFAAIMRYMQTKDEIQAAVKARLEYLRPLVEEHEVLARAMDALGAIEPPPAATPAPRRGPSKDPSAPYGLKADGTPRKRPGRRRIDQVHETARLQVQTAGVPAVKDGAEPAYVTQG